MIKGTLELGPTSYVEWHAERTDFRTGDGANAWNVVVFVRNVHGEVSNLDFSVHHSDEDSMLFLNSKILNHIYVNRGKYELYSV